MKQATLIVGRPGIGKSRKLYELCSGKRHFVFGSREDFLINKHQMNIGTRLIGFDGIDIVHDELDREFIVSLVSSDRIRLIGGRTIRTPSIILTVCGHISELPESFNDQDNFQIIDLN
jgi:hypothetical protein